MMSDLINGREMLKRYQEDLCYGIACKDCSMCTEDGGCRVEEWIDNFPSADRPQGYWTKTDVATKTKQVKYYDEDESVWKVGSVIVDE
jgi:hypothetical protein